MVNLPPAILQGVFMKSYKIVSGKAKKKKKGDKTDNTNDNSIGEKGIEDKL